MDSMNSGLTAVELAALRHCDDVCFFHRDGKSFMRAIKRKPAPSPSVPFPTEQIMEIDCGTIWHDYEKDCAMSWPIPRFTAFEMVGNYSDGALETTIAMLRKGDELKLHWQRSAGSHESMQGVGFVCDVLDLVIQRGAKRYRFHVDRSTCERHSSARMIRDVRPAGEYVIA